MCIRDSLYSFIENEKIDTSTKKLKSKTNIADTKKGNSFSCLLYTSDAADERSSVDLGGRRIIKKKKRVDLKGRQITDKRM